MQTLENKIRLAEIPKLVDLEHRELTRIAGELEKLEAERSTRFENVQALQREELVILRSAAA